MRADADDLDATEVLFGPLGQGIEEFPGLSPVLPTAGLEECPGSLFRVMAAYFSLSGNICICTRPTNIRRQLKLKNAGVNRLVVINLVQLKNQLLAWVGVNVDFYRLQKFGLIIEYINPARVRRAQKTCSSNNRS